MFTFHERKKERTDYYQRFVHGWKLRACSACSGSGHYDHDDDPFCGACDGTGKERYKPHDVVIIKARRAGLTTLDNMLNGGESNDIASR